MKREQRTYRNLKPVAEARQIFEARKDGFRPVAG